MLLISSAVVGTALNAFRAWRNLSLTSRFSELLALGAKRRFRSFAEKELPELPELLELLELPVSINILTFSANCTPLMKLSKRTEERGPG